MRRLRASLIRFAELFRKQPRESELAAEMESHLQLHMEENLRSGMTPERARREARMKLGGVEQVKEHYRQRRGLPLLETTLQDIRYALRTLQRSPGFSAVAVLTLVLGIGANTAMFSVVEGVVLAPLPYFESDRLVMILESNLRFPQDSISYPNFLDWQRDSHAFQRMAAYAWQGYRPWTWAGC